MKGLSAKRATLSCNLVLRAGTHRLQHKYKYKHVVWHYAELHEENTIRCRVFQIQTAMHEK